MGARPAERQRGAGRRDRPRQPVRLADHRGPRGRPPAAGPLGERALPGGVRLRRSGPGRVEHRPLVGRPDDGLRVRRPPRRDRAVPRRSATHGRRRRPRPDPSGAPAPGLVRRQPSRRGTRARRVPGGRVRARTDGWRHRAAAQGRPVPVRARRRRAAGPGLLRGLQHPGRRPGPAALRDRPAQGRHRRLRRPRLDARADRRRPRDGPPGAAAQRRAGLHDARVRDR